MKLAHIWNKTLKLCCVELDCCGTRYTIRLVIVIVCYILSSFLWQSRQEWKVWLFGSEPECLTGLQAWGQQRTFLWGELFLCVISVVCASLWLGGGRGWLRLYLRLPHTVTRNRLLCHGAEWAAYFIFNHWLHETGGNCSNTNLGQSSGIKSNEDTNKIGQSQLTQLNSIRHMAQNGLI